MYLRYAEPGDWPEDELKKQIVWSIKDIAEGWPDHFEVDTANIPPPETDTATFIALIAQIQCLHSMQATIEQAQDPQRALRIIFRILSILRWSCEIELRMLGVLSLINSSLFLGIRYVVAAHLIENDLGGKLRFDYHAVSGPLLDPHEPDTKAMIASCSVAAEEEIDRVLGSPVTREKFLDVVTRFDDSVEAQIKTAFSNIFTEMTFRLTTEAVITSAGIIQEVVADDDGPDVKEFKELLEQFVRKGMRFTSERLGITRGGRRTTDKFKWTDEHKQTFYETVTKLVNKNGEPLWKYAHRELLESDFSFRIVDFLRNETALKDVPANLWNRAVKEWKGNASSLVRLKGENTPEAFAMYHAVYLLGFPNTAFSTMKKYLSRGKKLNRVNKNS